MKNSLVLTLTALTAVVPLTAQFTYVDSFFAGGGAAEILSYTPDNFTLVATRSEGSTDTFGVEIFNFADPRNISSRGFADFSSAFGSVGDFGSVSSVALDPLKRGFGVAALIPDANSSTLGKVGIFDYNTGSVFGYLDVGYHPDNISFSKDGSQLYIANEGEYVSGGPQARGSVSVIDLAGITNAATAGNLANYTVNTYDFSASNLAAPGLLSGVRLNDLANPAEFGIEPEYITAANGRLYATLQENNAVGVFDLSTRKWEAIHDLGLIEQTVDGSDRDGPGGSAFKLIDDVVKGMPQPDTITTFSRDGKTYFVTVNEGDFRVDDNDRIRIRDIPRSQVDNALEAKLDAIYGDYRDNADLGRLRILKGEGDTDNDGDYDDFYMSGTRSISIWTVNDLGEWELVTDTGALESLLALLESNPNFHNMNAEDGITFDDRSDDKGPEPEALAVFQLNGQTWVVGGMERQNGLVFWNIDGGLNFAYNAYSNTFGEGDVAPESMLFISGADSPTGQAWLLTGYEVSNTIALYTVPEPAAVGAAALVLLGAFAWIRRRA